MPHEYHNWEQDARPFADCLADWMRLNLYSSYKDAADALGVNPTTFHGWRYGGRRCSYETTLRRLMTCLDRLALPPK